MTRTHPGFKRSLLSAGAVLAVGAAVTLAAVTTSVQTSALFDGTRNTLDIRAQASFDPAWKPAPMKQMSSDPIAVYEDDLGTLAAGESRTLFVAVANASPRNPAEVTMRIVDPDDLTGIPGANGEAAELFKDLLFTVEEEGNTLLDRVSGATAEDLIHTWSLPLEAEHTRFLTVTITLDPDVADPHRFAHSGMSIRFAGVNAPR